MAKVAFNKLNLKINADEIALHFNDQIIMIKQYLPIEKKIELITSVIQDAHDIDNNYSNPIKINIYRTIAIIDYYTNINFTDKQREDLLELYDKIVSSGLEKMIINAIPLAEFEAICSNINTTIDAYYKYRNSVLGILDNIQTDYSDLNLNVEEIKNKLSDPQALTFVRDLLSKVN